MENLFESIHEEKIGVIEVTRMYKFRWAREGLAKLEGVRVSLKKEATVPVSELVDNEIYGEWVTQMEILPMGGSINIEAVKDTIKELQPTIKQLPLTDKGRTILTKFCDQMIKDIDKCLKL